MKTSRSRIFQIVAIGLIILCCLFLVVLEISNGMAYQNTRTIVAQTIKPGMSERQVYEALGHVGTFRIFYYSQRSCQVEKSMLGDMAELYLHPDSWNVSLGFLVCFDESARLIYIREIID